MRDLLLSFSLFLGGCSTQGDADALPVFTPAPEATAAPAPRCVEQSPDACTIYPTLDEPSHAGAIVWAQAAAGSAGRTLGVPKIAVYADGTFERTPILPNVDLLLTPPRGVVLGKLADSAMQTLRADLAATSAADARAFFSPEDDDPAEVVLDLPGGRACLRDLGACTPRPLAKLDADATKILASSETLWRDALAGTVSLVDEAHPTGVWPLADDRAEEGMNQLTADEWSRVGQAGLYRLASGDYADVGTADPVGDGFCIYVTRRRFVAAPDDVAPALLATKGAYASSRGADLGVPLDASRFPSFKNREIALVAGKTYWLLTLPHFDLRADGDVYLEPAATAPPSRAPSRSPR
jgi:hypothetical protein